MQKAAFVSENLPLHGDDAARFARWQDIFESLVCCADIERHEDHRFFADFRFALVDGLRITRMDGMVSRIARTAVSIARDPYDGIGLVLNTGQSDMSLTQLGREAVTPPGAAFVLTNADRLDFRTAGRNSWVTVTIANERFRNAVGKAEDLVAINLDQQREAQHLLRRYLESIIELDDFGDNAALERHVGTTIVDLVALALGAKDDAAQIAAMRGLRAARMREMLGQIKANFADPGFSSQVLATKVGLSQRYVNKLLFETGQSFAERVLELRLQKAKAMLADARHDRMKVSDIVYACGFSEVSYFNRRFRARFGCSPTQYRGGNRTAE